MTQVVMHTRRHALLALIVIYRDLIREPPRIQFPNQESLRNTVHPPEMAGKLKAITMQQTMATDMGQAVSVLITLDSSNQLMPTIGLHTHHSIIRWVQG